MQEHPDAVGGAMLSGVLEAANVQTKNLAINNNTHTSREKVCKLFDDVKW